VQKLGEEVGMNVGEGVAGLTRPLAERGRGRGRRDKDTGGDAPAAKD
jgi:hypothetical protein